MIYVDQWDCSILQIRMSQGLLDCLSLFVPLCCKAIRGIQWKNSWWLMYLFCMTLIMLLEFIFYFIPFPVFPRGLKISPTMRWSQSWLKIFIQGYAKISRPPINFENQGLQEAKKNFSRQKNLKQSWQIFTWKKFWKSRTSGSQGEFQ